LREKDREGNSRRVKKWRRKKKEEKGIGSEGDDKERSRKMAVGRR
jgi:hypothetical protein